MNVLVTGGAGYLGSSVVSELLHRGHQVRLFDRFCFGEDALEAFARAPKCEIVRGDIRRLQEFPALMDNIDAAVHLAGLANRPACDLNPDMALDVNFESAREMANQALQGGVQRFLFTSTCEVYGFGLFAQLDEQSAVGPASVYGEVKLSAERALLGMDGTHFEPVVARLSTPFGWSARMRFDLAIHYMAATAHRNKRIEIWGSGRQIRPFMHVLDMARALADLLEAPKEKVSGEIFNVGVDDGNLTILDLANKVAAHFDGVEVEVLPSDEDRRLYRVSFDKLRREVDFKATHSLAEGIEELREGLQDPQLDPFDPRYNIAQTLKRLLETPVEDGGEPLAPKFVPLAKPALGPEEEQAVIETLRSGWLTSGPHIAAFEKAFAETVAAPHAVAVTSCTAALHLCLVHLGVQPGDEVITSPLTYGSVGNMIVNMGARVVFADIQRDTLNIDPDSVAKHITGRTKVIIPVHMAGEPCDLAAIDRLAKERGLAVVEDAAHALGATYGGRPIGSCSELACFSFYAIKNMTTVEGGIVTLRNEEVAARIRHLASHGMTATAWERYGRSAVASPPEVVDAGYKYQMSNVGAAIGLEQLKKFRSMQSARRRLSRLYRIALHDVDEIVLPKVADEEAHAWHLMIVRFKLDRLSKSRDEIAHALRQENVGTGYHFWGLHLHEYYRKTLGYKPEDLPEATAASNEVLSLPLHPGLRDKDVYAVVQALKKVLAHARKTG